MTSQIDVLSVLENKDGSFFVTYWDESIENEDPTTVQISEDSLLNYIIDNELNREEFINHTLYSLECDGLDERMITPIQYLEENRDEVIKYYITANS